MEKGKVLGHENLGEVIAIGKAVDRIKVGDQVCFTVNPGAAGGAYGYAGMGSYNGGQAEYLRVPYGDFNCLHQDVYGAVAFPLQLTCFLSQPGADYEGGEFVIVEQQPRAQSKAEVITAQQGQVLIFATRYRPVKGSRGFFRASLRHGVSRLKRGVRFTLGVIYHDSQ